MTENVYQIKKYELGKRVDIVLTKKINIYSRNHIINLIKRGRVKVNKNIIYSPATKLKELGFINVNNKDIKTTIKNTNLKLDVIFEDESIIVINKKAGVLTHASIGNMATSLVDVILEKGINLHVSKEGARAGVVHRLDKDTSGTIVFAKTELASNFLMQQFFLRKVDKIYEAIVWGKANPLMGKINIPIANFNKKKKASINKDAKSALTEYKTLQTSNNNFSLVECKIFTGRTHQIRIHMLSINCPLVGDPLYSKGRNLSSKIANKDVLAVKKFKRQALHSKQLGFIHPLTKKSMTFNAIKPDDFLALENTLFNN